MTAIEHPPREWAERFFNLQRWTDMPRGGTLQRWKNRNYSRQTFATWFRQFR
jgi:hypothetical protein